MAWIALLVTVVFTVLSFSLWGETRMIWMTSAVLTLAAIGWLVFEYRGFLKSRTGMFGIHSVVSTVIMLGILSVVNYFANSNPAQKDLTRNQLYSLSDQSKKLVKELSKDVHAVFYSRVPADEKHKIVLDQYGNLSGRFKVDYVDVNREISKAKQANIKQIDTLILEVGDKKEQITDIKEEAITNALIKLLKDKQQTVCSVVGHGEKNFAARDGEGYGAMKEGLEQQSVKAKDINLTQESKIPADCDSVLVLGPTSKYLDHEIKILDDYLAGGGRALIALDFGDPTKYTGKEFDPILKKWSIEPIDGLLIDQQMLMIASAGLRVDPAVLPVRALSKNHTITKGFPLNSQVFFPLSRSFEPAKEIPAGLNVEWLGKSSQVTWNETDYASLKQGGPKHDKGSEKMGEHITAVAAEGKPKDSSNTKSTRLVVLGTSLLGANQFARAGGNSDFFLNAVSWLVDDENLISIREKGDDKVEITLESKKLVFWTTVVFLPLFTAIGGIVLWARRRRL